jgi:NDP-sugar pyrophosphorylase family protein
MLPVLGKPMVVRMMELLYRTGIQHYIVVVSEDEGAVAAYLSSQWFPNVKVEFVIQPKSSSLAKTLADIARSYGHPFILTTYNSFVHPNFPERLLKHHRELGDGLILSGAPITLSKLPPRYFAVTDQQRVQAITTDKPTGGYILLANLAVCGQDFVQFLKDDLSGTGTFNKQLFDIFDVYIQKGGATFMVETAWILPVETDYDLLTVNKHLLDEQHDTHILSEVPPSVQIIPPVRIDPQVSVGQGARLGPRVYLEAGCSVGANATVANALILQNATVPARKSVSEVVVSSRGRIDNPDPR